MEGGETVGNSLGRAPVGRSDTGVTIGWTEGKPWEIPFGKSSGGKVGNSLGRAPVGRSDTGVTTGWTEGKPWGELWWEGAIRE